MRTKPLLIDLYCGAGVGADGYSEYFDIVGVDKYQQRRNPYNVVTMNALRFLDILIEAGGIYDGVPVAVIHASPPCQAYSTLRFTQIWDYPDLISATRERLIQLGLPYVIENVENAPLRNTILLCGTMFPGLRVIRHRRFESNIPLIQPHHIDYKEHPPVFTRDWRKSHYKKLDPNNSFVSITGGGNCSTEQALAAMQVTRYAAKTDLNQAIPPAYTRYVGEQLVRALQANRG